MACSAITSGVLNGCSDGNGGLEAIFIANGKVESITETGGVVSAITVAGSALTPSDFFKFETPRQTSSISEAATGDVSQGTTIYEQTAIMILNQLQATTRDQLALMFQADSMVVVAKTNMGDFLSIGLERGAYGVSATTTSGVNFADGAKYEITISGIEAKPMWFIDSAIVE